MRAAGGEQGFTLIELLVSLALLALLVTGLAPSLGLSAKAWDNVDRVAGEDAERLVIQDFLRRSLTEAYPLSFEDRDGRRVLAFEGAPDHIALVTPMPAFLGLGGLQVLRIGTDQHEGRRDLVAWWSPLRTDTAGLATDEGQRTVLAEGVAALSLAYYGSETPSSDPEWSETWRNTRALPGLVRVRVRFPEGATRDWPDLVARPMVDLAAMVRR